MLEANTGNITPKNYLLIPSVPTPNGRLHLGHIGGPYLSVDVLARYLRLSGHKARIMSGTDGFESYVTIQAAKEQKTPEQICHHYHPLIADDLAAMDIQIDQFINPVHEHWRPTYEQWHEHIYQQLVDRGSTLSQKELVTWDEQNNRFLTGCWLHGLCPVCYEKTSSYFCEACGAHYRPEEVIKEDKGVQKTVENVFLHVPKPENLSDMGINKKLEQLFCNYLTQQQHLFRLTANSEWGLRHNEHSTLFSYGFVYTYFLMLGELYGNLEGTNKNAFAKNSSVITIASFGHDNALPFLSSILGTSASCNEYKPFDHYLVNYFYHLNDAKFSTSRRHAIWVNEIINKHQLSSDIIRLYLSSIDVRNQTGNFSVSEFNTFYEWTIDWQRQFIVNTLANLPQIITSCEPELQLQLNQLLINQSKALQPEHFYPHEAIRALDEWLKLGAELNQQPESYFWWLQAFCLFLHPFMPRLSTALWQALGYEKPPALNMLFSKPTLPIQRIITLNLKTIKKLNKDLLVKEIEHD